MRLPRFRLQSRSRPMPAAGRDGPGVVVPPSLDHLLHLLSFPSSFFSYIPYPLATSLSARRRSDSEGQKVNLDKPSYLSRRVISSIRGAFSAEHSNKSLTRSDTSALPPEPTRQLASHLALSGETQTRPRHFALFLVLSPLIMQFFCQRIGHTSAARRRCSCQCH